MTNDAREHRVVKRGMVSPIETEKDGEEGQRIEVRKNFRVDFFPFIASGKRKF